MVWRRSAFFLPVMLGLILGACSTMTPLVRSPSNTAAPGFESTDSDGKPVSLRSLTEGRSLVLVFLRGFV